MPHTINTEWNLGLLYKNHNDPQIEKDIRKFERACSAFENKYRKATDYTKNEHALFHALNDFSKIKAMPEAMKPLMYFFYSKDVDSSNPETTAMLGKLSERCSKAGNKLVFFHVALSKTDPKKQKLFLKSKRLQPYNYLLKRVFLEGVHTLTEPEEKILNLMSQPSYNLWVQGQEKLLTNTLVPFGDKKIPVSEARNLIPRLPTEERRKLQDSMVVELKAISSFAESELNAVVTAKRIEDELKKYKTAEASRLENDQMDEKVVNTLVESVLKAFGISHEFFALKAKMLGLPSLEYADQAAFVGKVEKKMSFEEQYAMLRGVLSKMGERYTDILDSYLEKGQIDVFPKKGKAGGGYCSHAVGMPTFILLNDVGTQDSLSTLAHEMGHAFHAEFSKNQLPFYQNYSTAVAEVASTFFESVTFDAIFETLSEEEKTIALHNKIQDDIQTIFRQIAAFKFELELHKQIKEKGALSKEEISDLMAAHMKLYLGPSVQFKENDGYIFVYWMHFRMFFYVYSYAFGQIVSKALYAKYKADPKYLVQIEKFLSAGGSKSPKDIFKDIGIDVTKPDFFKQGLESIREDVKKLKKLLS